MAIYLERELVKMHLRVDHDDEDTLIDTLMESAESYCLSYLNRDVFPTLGEMNAAVAAGQVLRSPIIIQPHHVHAMLLLVGDFYARREASSDYVRSELPGPIQSLLKPDRIRQV